jgi:MoaE-MoaD fusion protein
MRIRVKLFASARERAGNAEALLELQDGADVAAAAEALVRQVPALGGCLERVAYAVNRKYAAAATRLKDGDELAVIPPVSGG